MQAVKLTTEPQVFVGTSTIVKTIFSLPEDTKIYWAGNRIYAKRLCGRDIVITKTDIFCEGQLEKGEYIREKSIPISNRVPPTVRERNLNYRIRSEISMIKLGTKSEEEFFFAETPITLKLGQMKVGDTNPVEVSITGIKIHIAKDQFQPGDIIAMDYQLEKLKDFEVDLVKDGNVTCYCPDYAPTCIHIKPAPPAVETSEKAKNLTSGTLHISLPSFIESTHHYLWEPPEKTRWKETFGDYVNWYLEVIGQRISGEKVKFQIPISIINKQTSEDLALFSMTQTKAPVLQKILVPDSIKIQNHKLDKKRLSVTFENTSKQTLQGITIKIIPIESEFFELPPYLTGINEWKPGSTNQIQAFHNTIGQNIKNVQINIEDNNGNTIKKRLTL